jgi:hypothetical protein
LKSHVFIGYDEREKDPYNVCVQSLKDSSLDPDRIIVHPLFHRDLRDKGLFDRPWRITEQGTYEDVRDGRPFSVQFSHTRFLTPYLARQKGIYDRVMFVDCDFLFLEDVNNIFDSVRKDRMNDQYAVHVVKHDYKPQNTVKMDGAVQSSYNKKLWSAMMMFDTTAKSCVELTPEVVNNQPGSYLHQFQWLRSDAEIGSIDPSWHYVAGHSTGKPKAVHYTEGGPWFDKYSNCEYAGEWYRSFYKHIQQSVPR